MKETTTVGIDLPKSLFTVHGVERAGRTVLPKTIRREKLMELVGQLSACLIGMEACGGAHEWARKFEACGHRVGIMMARFVAPYRKSSKMVDQ
jgi:transposase